ESPKHLRVESPVVKRFRDRKRLLLAEAGFEPAIHEFGLPFHKRKSAFGLLALPFVEKIGAVELCPRVSAGLVRAKCAGDSGEHNLRRRKIDRIFPARNPDEIFQAAQFAVGCHSSVENSVIAWISKRITGFAAAVLHAEE